MGSGSDPKPDVKQPRRPSPSLPPKKPPWFSFRRSSLIGSDPKPYVEQPRRPLPKLLPKKPPWLSFRRFSLMEWFMGHWKHYDIGMQDQVRWGLRLSGAYLGFVLGSAGLFWLSIPYIDKWREKEIMSGEFQRKIREKEEEALKGYSPEMIKEMEKFSSRVSGNVIYKTNLSEVNWRENWGSTPGPPRKNIVDVMDETANRERMEGIPK